jgi:hypothetical protein
VVRSKGDLRLDETDLNGKLEANATINIHWGGKGMKFNVSHWSEGCQVINGTLYFNDRDELVDCSPFVGRNNTDVTNDRSKTRGAYNVLVDVVTALGSDLPDSSIKYTLLAEQDLARNPTLRQGLADARAKVRSKLG